MREVRKVFVWQFFWSLLVIKCLQSKVTDYVVNPSSLTNHFPAKKLTFFRLQSKLDLPAGKRYVSDLQLQTSIF